MNDWEREVEEIIEEDIHDGREHKVEDENAGERIDKLLANYFPDVSRTQAQDWITNGIVTVNGGDVKSNYKVKSGDYILVKPQEPESYEVEAENLDLIVVYEDEDVIVIDKPRGMVVHPAAGHLHGTLVNGLLFHCKDLSGIGGVLRPGVVHRIDKDTSGLIMFAKNDQAHRDLAEQLKAHTVTRRYIGIVHGELEHEVGTIDAPVGRHPVHRKQMAVRKGGKNAVTHFQVLERFEGYTLVECRLETGRTHQIRVHMEFIGHPLVGDPVYGLKRTLDIDGQALHAQVLGFVHPRTKEYLEFTSDIPSDMSRLIELLRMGQ